MQENENFFIFYGQILSSSIARHSMRSVIFLLAAHDSFIYKPNRRNSARTIAVAIETLRLSEVSACLG